MSANPIQNHPVKFSLLFILTLSAVLILWPIKSTLAQSIALLEVPSLFDGPYPAPKRPAAENFLAFAGNTQPETPKVAAVVTETKPDVVTVVAIPEPAPTLFKSLSEIDNFADIAKNLAPEQTTKPTETVAPTPAPEEKIVSPIVTPKKIVPIRSARAISNAPLPHISKRDSAGRMVCAKKNDHPSKSNIHKKGHMDMECCLDPDEIPNPHCYYGAAKYQKLLKKFN